MLWIVRTGERATGCVYSLITLASESGKWIERLEVSSGELRERGKIESLYQLRKLPIDHRRSSFDAVKTNLRGIRRSSSVVSGFGWFELLLQLLSYRRCVFIFLLLMISNFPKEQLAEFPDFVLGLGTSLGAPRNTVKPFPQNIEATRIFDAFFLRK